ncbi:MAG: carboxylate-amine ligase [Actinomycetota bacterium]|nr:carboxylate-amine ligase [Actinomycetota bacterium]
MTPFTLGVEEEYLIVDAETAELRPRAERILAPAGESLGDHVQNELSLSQIEVETEICTTLEEVRTELVRLRKELMSAAEQAGSRIAATGTHPFTDWLGQAITPKKRYLDMAEEYRLVAWQQLICGCHVHVGLDDPEAAIQVMDRCRPWLPVLLALSANSPFWQGIDTGFDSFRIQLWERWPMSGTPGVFGSRAAYDALVEELIATGSVPEATRLYWDVRPSARFPTLEFRIADVCLTVDETVMVTGLSRSLARTCQRQALAGEPVPELRSELVRAARWRASRYGLDGELIDLRAHEAAPAATVVGRFLEFLRPDLEESGEWAEVSARVQRTLQTGNGARRQRRVFQETGSLRAVMDWVLGETATG